jgi:hypothetical protein
LGEGADAIGVFFELDALVNINNINNMNNMNNKYYSNKWLFN